MQKKLKQKLNPGSVSILFIPPAAQSVSLKLLFSNRIAQHYEIPFLISYIVSTALVLKFHLVVERRVMRWPLVTLSNPNIHGGDFEKKQRFPIDR